MVLCLGGFVLVLLGVTDVFDRLLERVILGFGLWELALFPTNRQDWSFLLLVLDRGALPIDVWWSRVGTRQTYPSPTSSPPS